MNRIIRATINSWNGLLTATRTEAAFRQELLAFAISIPLAFVIGTNAATRFVLIAAGLLVLMTELVNTAIEKLADRVTEAIDPRIGRVKDMGSAAVGLSLLIAAMAWGWAVGARLGWF